MRVYALVLAKNEDDVLAEMLRSAVVLFDRVICMDNGSTDESHDIVVDAARQFPGQVIDLGRFDEPFTNGLRRHAYNEFSRELGADGWWHIQDADEFLTCDPRPALHRAVREGADSVRAWQAQFAFTDADLAAWEGGREDPAAPIRQRRRWYRVDWREPRLFRNDPQRIWESVDRFPPEWIHRPTRWSIYNRHYQYRDPRQIQKRLESRSASELFVHERSTDWRSKVVPATDCHYHEPGGRWRNNRIDFYGARLKQRLHIG